MQAQSISAQQMDERFNDGQMPYGWFAEGWEVKDGVAQKASSGFDMATMMGGGGSDGIQYLMTPPLQVQAGEKLVFSARKAEGNGLGSMMGGSSDSTCRKTLQGPAVWVTAPLGCGTWPLLHQAEAHCSGPSWDLEKEHAPHTGAPLWPIAE